MQMTLLVMEALNGMTLLETLQDESAFDDEIENYLMDQGKKNLEEETKDAFKDPRIDNEDSQIGL